MDRFVFINLTERGRVASVGARSGYSTASWNRQTGAGVTRGAACCQFSFVNQGCFGGSTYEGQSLLHCMRISRALS